ncbi:shikimate kinase [Vibrio tapetis]|uniref:Adenylate kinase n=1 Tax=Vibrio tapetis subsp. tapetis TaxID=1671868 RepID=A0A2N8ZLZ0_9VIBR|nr:shikimate kinase [Vibrio tapetis]SON52915.1 Adenylate kinase [Vibrio tapetis subsp. tapetis]
MKRINIVGTSGSGKSTLGRALAKRLNAPFYEMDALYWRSNWQGVSDDVLFSDLKAITAQSSWVLDGNYNRTVPIKWAHVDTVIWVDYSFIRTLYQATKRALIRVTNKTELWPGTGNTESFRRTFMSKESVLLWMINHHSSNRQRYQKMMASDEYQHIRFIRVSTPKQAKQLVDGIAM